MFFLPKKQKIARRKKPILATIHNNNNSSPAATLPKQEEERKKTNHNKDITTMKLVLHQGQQKLPGGLMSMDAMGLLTRRDRAVARARPRLGRCRSRVNMWCLVPSRSAGSMSIATRLMATTGET